jgi:hypothetical protein
MQVLWRRGIVAVVSSVVLLCVLAALISPVALNFPIHLQAKRVAGRLMLQSVALGPLEVLSPPSVTSSFRAIETARSAPTGPALPSICVRIC